MLDLRLEYEYMKPAIDMALTKCLEHQQWILGPEVKALEEAMSQYLSARHCIGTSSGTEALVLSLRALAIKLRRREYFDRSDEIITTPFTFTATGDAILRSGATPVFVDIDPSSFNIDTTQIRQYLTVKSSRVVGIVPVHLYGKACNMDEMMKLAGEFGLFVVEDIAQAFGATWNNRKLGSVATAGAFSFFPSKNLGGFGDGGLVSTNDDKVAEIVRMLLKHGGKDKYDANHVGYNARLDTLQAAILLAKLGYLDEFNSRRKRIAEAYGQGFSKLNQYSVILPEYCSDSSHVYHQYTITVPERDKLQSFLKDHGIATMVYYPVPLHRMKVFGNNRSKSAGMLYNAEKASSCVLSLPIEPLQNEATTGYVIDRIKSFFD